MNKTWIKPFLALTLMGMTVATMAGCSRTEERVTERIMPPIERETTTTQQGVTERTVAEKTTMDLKTIQPGQPMGYYTRHFEDMGYQVMDLDRQNDRVIYDLGRGNEMERVTLFQTPGTDKVSRIETQKFTNVAMTGKTQDKTMQNVITQIEKMPPGKKPVDYISSLSKLGTVNEYRLHRDYAVVDLESANKHYKVHMDVNPSTKTVTDVKLDRNIWELPS